MAGWLVSRGDLTNDQARAVELPPDRNRVFRGGPGSGKTLVLLHRARHLAATLRVRPGRFLVLVYTNALVSFLRAAAVELGLPGEAVRTYDDWCAEHWERFVPGPKPHRADGVPDFAAVRRGVRQEVLRSRRRPLYDFVLVDEGQDLDAGAHDVLARLSSHVTVAVDPAQRIYDGGADEQEILAALGLFSCSVTLLESWRSSPLVARLAAALLPGEEERETFLRQVRAAPSEREKPLLYVARDEEDEVRRLVEIARARLLLGERVAVVLQKRELVPRVARELALRGLPVETPRRPGEEPGPFPPLDFSSDFVKLLPFHSAKGLTFDSVLVPAASGAAFGRQSPGLFRRLLFVALTRARRWTYLSASRHEVDGLPCGLAHSPDLIVQRWDDQLAAAPSLAQAPPRSPAGGVAAPAPDLASWL